MHLIFFSSKSPLFLPLFLLDQLEGIYVCDIISASYLELTLHLLELYESPHYSFSCPKVSLDSFSSSFSIK